MLSTPAVMMSNPTSGYTDMDRNIPPRIKLGSNNIQCNEEQQGRPSPSIIKVPPPVDGNILKQIQQSASRPLEAHTDMQCNEWLNLISMELPAITNEETWKKIILSGIKLPEDFDDFMDAKDLIQLLGQMGTSRRLEENNRKDDIDFTDMVGEISAVLKFGTDTSTKMSNQYLSKVQLSLLCLDLLRVLEVATNKVIGTIEHLFASTQEPDETNKKKYQKLTPSEILLLRQILKNGGSGKLSKDQVAMGGCMRLGNLRDALVSTVKDSDLMLTDRSFSILGASPRSFDAFISTTTSGLQHTARSAVNDGERKTWVKTNNQESSIERHDVKIDNEGECKVDNDTETTNEHFIESQESLQRTDETVKCNSVEISRISMNCSKELECTNSRRRMDESGTQSGDGVSEIVDEDEEEGQQEEEGEFNNETVQNITKFEEYFEECGLKDEPNRQENVGNSFNDDIKSEKKNKESSQSLGSHSSNSSASISSSVQRFLEADRERIENYIKTTVAKTSTTNCSTPIIDWVLFNKLMACSEETGNRKQRQAYKGGKILEGKKNQSGRQNLYPTRISTAERCERQNTQQFYESKLSTPKTDNTEEGGTISTEENVFNTKLIGNKNVGLTNVPPIKGIIEFSDGIPTTYDEAFLNLPPFAQASNSRIENIKLNNGQFIARTVSNETENGQFSSRFNSRPVPSMGEARHKECAQTKKHSAKGPQSECSHSSVSARGESGTEKDEKVNQTNPLRIKAKFRLIRPRTQQPQKKRHQPKKNKRISISVSNDAKEQKDNRSKMYTENHMLQESVDPTRPSNESITPLVPRLPLSELRQGGMQENPFYVTRDAAGNETINLSPLMNGKPWTLEELENLEQHPITVLDPQKMRVLEELQAGERGFKLPDNKSDPYHQQIELEIRRRQILQQATRLREIGVNPYMYGLREEQQGNQSRLMNQYREENPPNNFSVMSRLPQNSAPIVMVPPIPRIANNSGTSERKNTTPSCKLEQQALNQSDNKSTKHTTQTKNSINGLSTSDCKMIKPLNIGTSMEAGTRPNTPPAPPPTLETLQTTESKGGDPQPNYEDRDRQLQRDLYAAIDGAVDEDNRHQQVELPVQFHQFPVSPAHAHSMPRLQQLSPPMSPFSATPALPSVQRMVKMSPEQQFYPQQQMQLQQMRQLRLPSQQYSQPCTSPLEAQRIMMAKQQFMKMQQQQMQQLQRQQNAPSQPYCLSPFNQNATSHPQLNGVQILNGGIQNLQPLLSPMQFRNGFPNMQQHNGSPIAARSPMGLNNDPTNQPYRMINMGQYAQWEHNRQKINYIDGQRRNNNCFGGGYSPIQQQRFPYYEESPINSIQGNQYHVQRSPMSSSQHEVYRNYPQETTGGSTQSELNAQSVRQF